MRGRIEAGRALRTRGTAEEGLFARPESPSRWTLPITALRVTPPSSAAIWLADRPSAQSFFSISTRSSVQFIVNSPVGLGLRGRRRSDRQNPFRTPESGIPRPSWLPLRQRLKRTSAARDVVFDGSHATIGRLATTRVPGTSAPLSPRMCAVVPKNCGVYRAQRSHRGELTGSAAPINCPKCRSYRRAAPFVSAFSGFAGILEAVLIAPLLP